jgi:hypothetical protein
MTIDIALLESVSGGQVTGHVGVSVSQAAANFAGHSPFVPGVSLGPARITSSGSGVTAVRSASGLFGQHLTSTLSLSPARGGGTNFRESTSGSGFARAVHGAVYTSETISNILSGH